MKNLSKSKLIAFRQCPKRLWLEVHRPELRDDSGSEAVFQIGYQVGDIARQIYDPGAKGTTIDVTSLGHGEALQLSAELLRSPQAPLFEAGLTIPGALAYADVMLPVKRGRTRAWRMIEVKSATSVKDYHRDDLAVQWFIATEAGLAVDSAAVAHIDTTFVYQGDGDYRGLLKEEDLTTETAARLDEVRTWLKEAHAVAAAPTEPDVATGAHCHAPFTCGFCAYCHQNEPSVEFPLSSLPRLSAPRRDQFEAHGYTDLREVPDDQLNAIQQRVKSCSQNGLPFFDRAGAKADLAPHPLPACFLDFETIAFAVPIWRGQRPYQQVPFQFSAHQVDARGRLRHHEFFSLDGQDPSRAFAIALIQACGNTGPVFVYNAAFERRILNQLAEVLPDLSPALRALHDRVVDLLPIARQRYYHPSQQGSWSLKAVLPALCPELSYADLDGVNDGELAQQAYLEAIATTTTAERKAEIQRQLLAYCQLDTLGLVKIWAAFSGRPTPKSA